MTRKEEAQEIYYRFTVLAPLHEDNKKCALIAVDMLISETGAKKWYEIKTEIEKL